MTEEINEAKKIISDAKNIYIIPSQANDPESIACALALFYTLKEFGKNVNLVIDELPEKFNFLAPSLDFISLPKNFVISIPNKKADISQIYYEKNNDSLKIHLSLNSGHIKKDDISFYFSETKPDVIITIGIKDFNAQLIKKLDFYGFLMESPILNIDNNSPADENNKNFGKINLLRDNSLSEITLDLIKSIDESLIKKEAATCFLTALIIFYENFKSAKTSHTMFDVASFLMKKGADHQQINDNLYKIKSPAQIKFLSQIFKNLNIEENKKIFYAVLNSEDFYDFNSQEASFAIDHIKTSFLEPNNLLVLWRGHGSDQKINGFFYSKNKELINNIWKITQGEIKNNWIFLSIEGSDIEQVKNKILQEDRY